MNRSTVQLADSQHPWIGLASFMEADREFFAGRGDEIEQLLRLVRRDTLTLLYGVSGLGKTSLLQAGLFPLLREENYLPVPVRLDYLEGAGPLAKQVFDAITAAAAEARVDAPQPQPGETLWEYFHRSDNHFWSLHNDLVTPFLVFDQFEEFFTLGRENADRTRRGLEFISELADLVENRPPAALREDPSRAKQFSFKPMPVSVLLSMREDYLGDLDYIRSKFRALAQNRLRLRPMGEPQARQVIALGASFLAPGAADRIVRYVAGAGANGDAAEITVAPALLSLVLRELNERRLRGGPDAKITADLLDIEQEKILEDFYLETLKDLPVGVRTFVEDKLLTASGHRNSCALDDALTRPDVTQAILDKLVNRRLLAYEDRHRTRRVEITHDVLLPTIRASRDARLTSEALAEADRLRARQAAEKRKQQITTAVAFILALALIATILGGYYAFFQEHKAYYLDFAKKHGFPVGIGPLSKSEARSMPVSFLLVKKGIVRQGWKLHWKPAFRVVAMDSLLKPTTHHSVGTYLWHAQGESESEDTQDSEPWEKGLKLGLQNVCQWEFVSTAKKGEPVILYERGLDRDGRMVYGLIYSPLEKESGSTRLARYVGPNGFPQLQRRSVAEYVLIHYDKNGWEDRIMYRDGKNQPATGPDGAFGQSITYNNRGQRTFGLSLDAHEHNMIDNAGNCGMQNQYDAKGRLTEAKSLGPDLRPMLLKNGIGIYKAQIDQFGREVRATFDGINGKPVLNKDGYHGWEAQYDERGNRGVLTYIGLDDNPTLLADGYATLKSTYDARGNMTGQSYHGVNGEPVVSRKDSYHGWEAQYDERGNQIMITYLDVNGKPILLADGYATLKSTYDTRGKVRRRSYHGVKGDPVQLKDGYHGWEAEYDEPGNQIGITYLGLDGKPVVLPLGFAVVRSNYDSDGNQLEAAFFDAAKRPALGLGFHKRIRGYDARGKLTRETYYGVNGEPVQLKEGFHGFEAQYDERGNRIAVTYIGLDKKPTLFANGYATLKSTYDAHGKETRRTYHGVDGEPVQLKEGFHGFEAEYDERGNPIVSTYIGLDGKPTLFANGYATQKSTYDAHGKEMRRTYHGVNGEPVQRKEGFHGWEAEFDERGNEIVLTYIGLDGKPTLLADGYAIVKSTYNTRGIVTGRSYHGVNGEPVVSGKDGYHGLEAEYDERGNEIVLTYIGLDGKRTLLANRYAMLKSTYDARGNMTGRSYHGINGEPVVSRKDGYHGWEERYDERWNPIATTFVGSNGQPTLLADGYATLKSTYDARGNMTGQSYHGINGEPVVSRKDGYHGWEEQYDERWNPIATTYVGSNGKPTLLADGYATLKSTYDARGNMTGQSYHGVNGEPVVSRKDGYHGWEAQYDERGNQIMITYLDVNGKPTLLADGYATLKSTYDTRGNIAGQSYQGVKGEPVVSRKETYHSWEARYDWRGNQIQKIRFGRDGKPQP
jgi:CTP:molybdopterin cytidylyltransferase MocA